MHMNSAPTDSSGAPGKWISKAILSAAFCVTFAFPASALAVITDNFSDLDDTANPAWVHLSGLIGSTGQTWDASTGEYRLRAPNNGIALDARGPFGYVGSYVPTSFTDVKVTADFTHQPTGGAYGILARTDGVDGINVLKGYGYAYEPFTGVAGEMTLFRINGADIRDIGSIPLALDFVNKSYTFSLEIIGTQLHGQVHEIGGGLVSERFATDATYASGYSGLFGYSVQAAGVETDLTIDNFRTAAPGPVFASDFDDDGVVDGDDLAIWKSAFTAGTVGGDANGDLVTDGNDFLIWQRENTAIGSPAAIAASAIPEPLAVQLVVPAVAFLLASMRRRPV